MNVTQTGAKTQPTAPAGKLEYAINLARAGRKLEARDVLRQIVALQPVNQAAWLWLSAVATDRAEAETALAQARKINPAHPSLAQAEQWLANRFSSQPATKNSPVIMTPSSQSVSSPPQKFKKLLSVANSFTFGLILVVVAAGLFVLFLGLSLEVKATVQGVQTDKVVEPQSGPDIIAEYAPGLKEAQARQDWTRVIAILEERQRAEANAQLVQAPLAQAYLQKGLTLRHKGFVEEASTYFERVLTLDPQQAQAQQELALASNYLAGAKHYQAGQWQETITTLEAVRAEDADYINVKDLLFSAYYNHGLALQAASEFLQAKTAFVTATTLRPDLSEPYLQIAEIEFALAPQTPLAAATSPTVSVEDKMIVVGIAEQRMYVYEGDQQVFDFVVSTGEPGRDTAIGDFEILDKIDLAYASTWNLDMPYWMGIYWSGPLENGIHALPVVKHTGYKLWDGYLGQRVSYGCIILSDTDAVTLYNWAEVGTKVKIVPSLANRTPPEQ
jgi:lipoprotein-anchoring transpeptidase ErfK/SrfK